MGILRTNKISGLETPTPVTGSVSFDGSGDYLSLASSTDFAWGTGDFTWETWAYSTASDHTTGNNYIFDLGTGNIAAMSFYQNKFNYYNSTIGLNGQLGSFPANKWTHIAVSRKNLISYIFIDGILQGSISDTHNYGTSALAAKIGEYAGGSGYGWDGYISNLRILKGTALYTSNFTPPVHELQPIGDTVLLCCNNPDSAGAEATGKTITVNGNAAASTFSPGLTRDFTFGTQFEGVAKFDTQGYFVPPSGTTEQRGAGRGLFGGGYVPGGSTNAIDFINIQSLGIAQDFGDLSNNMGAADGKSPCAVASSSRALFAGGYSAPGGPVNTVEYVTIATTSNSTDFGDLSQSRRDLGACASSTRATFGGGTTTGSTSATNIIDYVTIASIGNAVDYGDLTQARRSVAACSSPTRGVWGGGYVSNSPATFSNRIDYITIASTGNATTFGDLTVVRSSLTSCSNSTRGIFAGGSTYTAPASTYYNTIDYITISSTGNAQDFGDLSATKSILASASSPTRGVFGGGGNPSIVNTMEFIAITSTGNASDFGDLTVGRLFYNGGCSDSHGGIS